MKIHGVRAVASASKSLQGRYGAHLQILYNMDSGEVCSVLHLDPNGYTIPSDQAIITVRHICQPCTMREVREWIAQAMREVRSGVVF